MITPKMIAVQGGGKDYPQNVSNFAGVNVDDTVALTWEDPDDLAWGGTQLRRKQGGYPLGINDGVFVVDSIIRNQYAETGYSDTGLADGSTWYYMAFPYDTGSGSDRGISNNVVNRIPGIMVAHIYPSDMVHAAIAAGNEQLTYTFELPADAVSCRIVYKTGAYPTGIDDGAVIESATSGGAITGLINDTMYYFVFCPKNSYGRYNFDPVANGRTGVPIEGFAWTATGDYSEGEKIYSDGIYYQVEMLITPAVNSSTDKVRINVIWQGA